MCVELEIFTYIENYYEVSVVPVVLLLPLLRNKTALEKQQHEKTPQMRAFNLMEDQDTQYIFEVLI